MSGGSWDYFCFKMDEVSERLLRSDKVERRHLGKVMKDLSSVMHSIEWADSGDISEEEATKAINNFIKINSLIDKELIIQDIKSIESFVNEVLK